jgi:hypothetical protein
MKNKSIYIIMLASLMMLTLILSIPTKADNNIYEDIIIGQYNQSCIETANYQYVFINNTFSGNLSEEISVKEIKQLSNKSVLADIFK